jgi:glucokinase
MLNLATVDVINDFAAVGHAVAVLQAGDWRQVGGAEPVAGKPVAVIGPGTGLGICTLVPTRAGYQVVDGEGGHVDFAPVDARELAVLELLLQKYQRVSVERLLSGAGIVTIHQSLAALAGIAPSADSPARITELALAGEDSLSVNTLQMFCRILGSTAGNLALTVGARGGVYIAGGIVPRFVDVLAQSGFRHRFEDKGRFRSYLADIPVRVVTRDHLGLLGAVRKMTLENGK